MDCRLPPPLWQFLPIPPADNISKLHLKWWILSPSNTGRRPQLLRFGCGEQRGSVSPPDTQTFQQLKDGSHLNLVLWPWPQYWLICYCGCKFKWKKKPEMMYAEFLCLIWSSATSGCKTVLCLILISFQTLKPLWVWKGFHFACNYRVFVTTTAPTFHWNYNQH